MDTITKEISKVPLPDKKELLLYIASSGNDIPVKLYSNARGYYFGLILALGNTRVDGAVITMQLYDERGYPMENYVYLPVNAIESIELIGAANALRFLSLGQSRAGIGYDNAGKLDVKRAFREFTEAIRQKSGVEVAIADSALPDNQQSLGRIIKLLYLVQQVITDLFTTEDARQSWAATYKQLSLHEGPYLAVQRDGNQLQIHFPFADIHAAEIDPAALTHQLLGVL